MTKRLRNIVVSVGVVAGLAGGIFWFRGNSTLFNLFFTPSGFYEPLASEMLDREREEYIFQVSHQYPGQYAVEIRAPSSQGVGVSYEADIRYEVILSLEGRDLFRRVAKEPYSEFWSRGGGGIVLAVYRVPESVPKASPVRVVVKIFSGVEQFNAKYGESKLIVAKRSDE